MDVRSHKAPSMTPQRRAMLAYAALALVMLAAAVFYCITLNVRQLHIDEYRTYEIAGKPFVDMLHNRADVGHAPLYFSLMWVLQQWVDSTETVLRLPSVGLGVLAIGLIFLLVRKASSTPAALIAAALVAANPVHLYMSQLARPYALLIVLALAAACLIQHERDPAKPPRTMHYACIALLVTLMCHTSYAAWFIVPVFVLYALMCRPRRIDVVIAVIVAGLLLVPWLIYQGYVEVTDQTQMLAHMQWVAPFDVRSAMSAPAKLLVGFDRSPLVPASTGVLAAITVVLVMVGGLQLGPRARLIGMLWAGSILLVIIASEVTEMNLIRWPRYYGVVALMQCALLAGAVAGTRWRWPVWVRLCLVVLLLAASAVGITAHLSWVPGKRVRDIAQFIQSRRTNDESVVVTASKSVILQFGYYFQGQYDSAAFSRDKDQPLPERVELSDVAAPGSGQPWSLLLPRHDVPPSSLWLCLSSFAADRYLKSDAYEQLFDAQTHIDHLRSHYQTADSYEFGILTAWHLRDLNRDPASPPAPSQP